MIEICCMDDKYVMEVHVRDDFINLKISRLNLSRRGAFRESGPHKNSTSLSIYVRC
jgi:hypothetical protein